MDEYPDRIVDRVLEEALTQEQEAEDVPFWPEWVAIARRYPELSVPDEGRIADLVLIVLRDAFAFGEAHRENFARLAAKIARTLAGDDQARQRLARLWRQAQGGAG